MACVAPRSTSSHWGSLKALDQRVRRFPSTALAATHGSCCTDDAVTERPWDSRTTGCAGAGARTVTGWRVGVAPPAAVLSAARWLVAAIAMTAAVVAIAARAATSGRCLLLGLAVLTS